MYARRCAVTFYCICLLILVARGHSTSVHAADADGNITTHDLKQIQAIVDEFLARLAIQQKVAVSVVPSNPLIVSVEFDEKDAAFLLSLQEDFMDGLTRDELQAAIAHELGHVWIFTHHPYLQTEVRANEIARRLVTRDSLVQVYRKVWKHKGMKGDPDRFVGD